MDWKSYMYGVLSSAPLTFVIIGIFMYIQDNYESWFIKWGWIKKKEDKTPPQPWSAPIETSEEYKAKAMEKKLRMKAKAERRRAIIESRKDTNKNVKDKVKVIDQLFKV